MLLSYVVVPRNTGVRRSSHVAGIRHRLLGGRLADRGTAEPRVWTGQRRREFDGINELFDGRLPMTIQHRRGKHVSKWLCSITRLARSSED